MKWPIIILASLQLLLINAQSSTLGQPCSVGKTCVQANKCRRNRNQVDKLTIDQRRNPNKFCNYLETCCLKRDQIDEPTVPKVNFIDIQANCGFRNRGDSFFGLPFAKRNEAEYSEFPWVVGILKKNIDKNTRNICSGSIITPNIILTAAHCVYNQAPKDLIVRAGEWDTKTESEPLPTQDSNVKEIIYDKHFRNETLHFDVALLVLKEPFMLDQNVRTICLPLTDQINQTDCVTTGWGKNQLGREDTYQTKLKKIRLPLVEPEDCQEKLRKTRLGRYFELHESFMCAGGERDVDACVGDGGAPLFCRLNGPDYRYVQVGTVAWGIGCGTQDVPGVYANLSYILEWLIKTLNQHDADPRYYTT